MRRLVVEALRKDGNDVTEVADGGAMLARLAEAVDDDPSLSSIDVIVTDLRMPRFNGLELVERLADARSAIPTILMTAFGDDETRRRAKNLGACYLEKPLSMAALCGAVRRLVREKETPPGDCAGGDGDGSAPGGISKP